MSINQDVNDFDDDDWKELAERNLLSIANGSEGMVEKLDKDGVIHELSYKNPPNPDINKFILTNMSKGKWADKKEITSTQINVNLTACYNDVNRMLEKQRQQALIEDQNKAIDVEFKEVE